MDRLVERFKEVMAHYNVSQNALAKLINISQSTLNNQLTGRTALSLDAVLSLLNMYQDISAEWLLRGRGSMFGGKDTAGHDPAAITKLYDELLQERDNKIRDLEMQNIKLKAIIGA